MSLGSKIVATLGWLGVGILVAVILLIAVITIILNKKKEKSK